MNHSQNSRARYRRYGSLSARRSLVLDVQQSRFYGTPYGPLSRFNAGDGLHSFSDSSSTRR